MRWRVITFGAFNVIVVYCLVLLGIGFVCCLGVCFVRVWRVYALGCLWFVVFTLRAFMFNVFVVHCVWAVYTVYVVFAFTLIMA